MDISNIIIRKYTEKDLLNIINIWNQVVEDGIAFPQDELLDEITGQDFFASQTYTAVAEDKVSGKIYGLYILHPNNVGRCGHYEDILREKFLEKGGKITRKVPYYMVVGECKFLEGWYENSAYIKINIDDFEKNTISFTYGDSHPTFSDKINDNKEYRKKLYTYDEILDIIDRYGLPQDWNSDGIFGTERYR